MRAYLGLGSNLGDRLGHLRAGVSSLSGARGVDVVAVSSVYRTEPVGGPEQPEFLNAVVAVSTTLAPRELLALTRRIEGERDRMRKERWGPRTLDVDILLYGDITLHEADLEIPHPGLAAVSYTHLRAHETRHDLVCRLLLEKKKTNYIKHV